MVLYLYIFFGGFEVRAHVACQPQATLESSLTVNVKTAQKKKLDFTSASEDFTKTFSCISVSSQKFAADAIEAKSTANSFY